MTPFSLCSVACFLWPSSYLWLREGHGSEKGWGGGESKQPSFPRPLFSLPLHWEESKAITPLHTCTLNFDLLTTLDIDAPTHAYMYTDKSMFRCSDPPHTHTHVFTSHKHSHHTVSFPSVASTNVEHSCARVEKPGPTWAQNLFQLWVFSMLVSPLSLLLPQGFLCRAQKRQSGST